MLDVNAYLGLVTLPFKELTMIRWRPRLENQQAIAKNKITSPLLSSNTDLAAPNPVVEPGDLANTSSGCPRANVRE